MSQLDQAFIRAYGRKTPATPAPTGKPSAGASKAIASDAQQPPTRIDDPAEAILAAVDDLLRQARPLAGAHGAQRPGAHFVYAATASLEQAASPLPPLLKATKPAEPVILKYPEAVQLSAHTPKPAVAAPEPAPTQVAAPEPVVAPEPAPMQPLSQLLGMHEKAAAERTPFRAAWEVDGFHWPHVCDLLLESSEDLLDEITGRIQMAAETGRNLLVLRGTRRGAGATAAAAFFARVMAGTGMHVALLDGDLANPQLGPQLGLGNYHGWEHALLEEDPLEESAVASLDDALTLLPLGQMHEPARIHAEPERFAEKLAQLSADFDLLVIDAGAVDIARRSLAGPPGLPASLVATLLVSDVRHGGREPAAARRLIAESGELLIGTFENFAPAAEESRQAPTRKMAA